MKKSLLAIFILCLVLAWLRLFQKNAEPVRPGDSSEHAPAGTASVPDKDKNLREKSSNGEPPLAKVAENTQEKPAAGVPVEGNESGRDPLYDKPRPWLSPMSEKELSDFTEKALSSGDYEGAGAAIQLRHVRRADDPNISPEEQGKLREELLSIVEKNPAILASRSLADVYSSEAMEAGEEKKAWEHISRENPGYASIMEPCFSYGSVERRSFRGAPEEGGARETGRRQRSGPGPNDYEALQGCLRSLGEHRQTGLMATYLAGYMRWLKDGSRSDDIPEAWSQLSRSHPEIRSSESMLRGAGLLQ